jgi:hypothetical protein
LDRQFIYDAFRGRSLILTSGAFAVSQHAAGANMSVDLAPGHAVMVGNAVSVQGSYLIDIDSVQNVPIAAAPPSGQSRIDVVYALVQDDFVDSGGNNSLFLSTSVGTPTTGTPAVPTVPNDALPLAQIAVGALVTSIVTANITDVRPPYAPGIFPANPSGSTFVSYVDLDGRQWVAKGGVNGGAWRLAEDVLNCDAYRSSAINLPSGGMANCGVDAISFDAYGMYNISTGVFTAPVAGKYRLYWGLCASPTATGQWIQAGFAGGILAQATAQASSGSAPLTCPLLLTASLTAGQTVTLQANCSTASIPMAAVGFGIVRALFTAEYVGL